MPIAYMHVPAESCCQWRRGCPFNGIRLRAASSRHHVQATEPQVALVQRRWPADRPTSLLQKLEAEDALRMRAGIARSATTAGAHSAPAGRPQPCPFRTPLLAMTCSTNEPLPRLLQWIRYHQVIGFSVFYFFVEGAAEKPEVVGVLRTLVGVKVRRANDASGTVC